MSAQATPDDLSSLLQRHADLESKFGDGDGGRFLSGWQCANPLAEKIRLAVERESRSIDPVQYVTFGEDRILQQELKHTHRLIDGVMPETIMCGSGSSSLIFTFCAWLCRENISEVYYIPPLYFTFHFALKLLNIRARAISGRHAFEPDFSFNLPNENTVLLLTDPIWYAGIPLSLDLINSLVEWQRRTRIARIR